MGRSLRLTLIGSLSLVVLASVPHAVAQTKAPAAREEDPREVNLRAYVELLRSDLRAQKTAVLAEVLQLDEKEDALFWPIYREYEADLTKVNDDRIALIRDYALNYERLTDDVADKLALRALDLEARRHTLKTAYYNRLKAALPARTAARVLQVESQILLILDLQIAASLPIVNANSR